MSTPGPRFRDLTPGRARRAAGDAPVVPVFLLGSGMYLAWFGIHYWKSDVKWPTDPVKAVLQGKQLPPPKGTRTEAQQAVVRSAQQLQANAAQQLAQAGVGTGVSTNPPNAVGQAVAAGTGSAASNQHIGKLLAAGYGWDTGANWNDLVKLWNQESGWNNHAENPSSHAYGIPQALPYTKMPKSAWPERAGGQSDPRSQISWGLAYIRSRYGSPSAAWAHEVSNNWY